MSKADATGEDNSLLKRMADLLSGILTLEIIVILSLVILGFVIAILSLTLLVSITPSTIFGESIEGVVPTWYWFGIAIMIVAISYMLTRLDTKKLRIPFLFSCVMLIISIRSVLAILSPFPSVSDTWGGIYVNLSWLKYGFLSPEGLAFLQSGYVRGWPISFIIAHLTTYAGIPVYMFYQWAPTIIFILELVVVYFLFKELANEKIGLVSAFLFTLLNTASVFTLHYSAQGLGGLFYLITMYSIVKAYKTGKLKHLALALISIFAVILTHHMTTLYLGIGLAGIYLSKYFLGLQQKISNKNRWFSFKVNLETFIKFSLPLSVFTFALWYFYGFIVYHIDATWMLTEIVRLLTTNEPQYGAGYYYYYTIQPPMSKLAVLIFPAFIIGTATIFLLSRMLKKKSLEGYQWLTMGWAGALILAFIFGNMIYGNYIDPSRSRELITLALYPASASFLLKIFESKSPYKKALITVVLIIIAFFSVFSIYRGAQDVIYLEPPRWVRIFNPP